MERLAEGPRPLGRGPWGRVRLDGVGPQAAGADARPKGLSRDGHAAHLEVGQEPPVDPVLGVADVMSVLRRLAANRALLGHGAPSGWRWKRARQQTNACART